MPKECRSDRCWLAMHLMLMTSLFPFANSEIRNIVALWIRAMQPLCFRIQQKMPC